MKRCRNCESSQLYDADFCHVCGQKHREPKYPLWNFISELADAVFNFESRTLRSVAGLFFPAKLTLDYFSGKQVRYIRPLRIFLLTAGLFLAVFGYKINKVFSAKADKMSDDVHEFFVKQQVFSQFDTVYSDFKIQYKDSFPESIGDSLTTAFRAEIFDSLELGIAFSIRDSLGNGVEIPARELAEGDVDRLMDKYNIEGRIGEVLVRQLVRFTKSPNAFIQKMLATLIWMILLLMPAVASFLKLLYIRRGKFFMEHLLFALHFHSFAFLVLAVVLGFFSHQISYIALTVLLILIYLFLAMKLFYRQSVIKTFAKWWFMILGYILIFSVCFLIWFGAGFVSF